MNNQAAHESERPRSAFRAGARGLGRLRRRIAEFRPRPPNLKRPSRRSLYWAGGITGALALAIAVLAAVWDWNWFRGPLASYMSARMHREVTIAGDLDVHPWSWRPRATLEGLRIENPGWQGEGRMAEVERIALRIRLLPLLVGRVDLQHLEFVRPDMQLYRDAKGRANWDFSDGRDRGEPMRLPPIRNFVIEDGKLRLEDARRDLIITGTVNAAEALGARNRGFELVGRGSINREPFTIELTGGPLVNIDRGRPYPFDLDIRAGETRVTARGAVPEPFDLGRFHMQATARGPDLADLYRLTGVALPNTPPYSLRGRLSREARLYRITGVGGRVGDSDLAGELSVDTGQARPFLKAELRSRSLDFDDLGAIFGGAPATGPGETASPRQEAVARTLGAQQRIFPDSPLDVDRIRAIDADVTYRAQSIRDAPVNLQAGSVRVKLDEGVLRGDPVRLDLPQGQVAGHVQLDARPATPVTEVDLRLSGGRLEQLVPVRMEGRTPYRGALVGRAKLRGQGRSVHEAFANADGEVLVVTPGGEIRKAFAELMGVNVVRGLGLLLADDRDSTPIRCGVAHFQAQDGVMTAGRVVFDTGPVLVTGSGRVNLGSERLAFRLQGHPKKLRLMRLMLPITVEGPIRRPKLGVEPGQAVAQGGVAAALAALVAPLAAVLPFVDPGLAEDANCGGLIAQARKEGAPAGGVAR